MYAATSFATLGHPARLAVFRLLMRHAPRGVRPTELCETLGLKPNTLSHHLADLEHAGLVRADRQGRSIFYAVDLGRAGDLVSYLAHDCCHGRPDVCGDLSAARPGPMLGRNVLFICSGNSARSIFAEALLRQLGQDRFHAFSAGTRPGSQVNPATLAILDQAGIRTSGLRAKHIAEFEVPGAPEMDFVFTVCDTAASEECAPWAGHPMTAHWGIPDPVKSLDERAFQRTFDDIRRRVTEFTDLAFDRLDPLTLQHHLDHIGRLVA